MQRTWVPEFGAAFPADGEAFELVEEREGLFDDAAEFAQVEHADRVDQETLIGFAPTHAVDIVAFCNSPVDHVVTALLTAAVMDLIGGIANVELREDQLPIVAGLPGIVATVTDPWLATYGSADFLRAWVQQPGFRLLK